MSSTRPALLALLSAVVLGGTLYSVVYHTYLDTSDPLLAHLPHPLHHKSLFAQKTNVFNTVFIKKAWGWTSAAFAVLWLTSPPHARMREAWFRWAAATLVWYIVAAWFFGPSVLERFLVASGGQCIVRLPSKGPGQTPILLSVPSEHCFTRTTISPETHPTLFAAPLGSSLDIGWKGIPKLYRGHDISGHIFLLTFSVLFLHNYLEPAWRLVASATPTSVVYKLAAAGTTALFGLWILMSWMTSVYWHTPLEKVTGFALGVISFALIQIPFHSRDLPAAPTSQRARED